MVSSSCSRRICVASRGAMATSAMSNSASISRMTISTYPDSPSCLRRNKGWVRMLPYRLLLIASPLPLSWRDRLPVVLQHVLDLDRVHADVQHAVAAVHDLSLGGDED